MKLNLLTLAVVLAVVVYYASHAYQLAWTPAHIAGLALGAPAFLLFVAARLQLGGAFSIKAEASKLVTTGLYSRIRNPIYVFGALMMVGIVIFVDRPWWLLALAILVPLQVRRSRQEAKVLEEKFGVEYLDYKRKTWF